MGKKEIKNTQCRRPNCLGPLTWVERDSAFCKHCEKKKSEHFDDSLYCYGDSNNLSTFEPKKIRKLLDSNYCEKCLKKEERRKKRIKKAQRKIGIKQLRKKKKSLWKTKASKIEITNKPITVVYAKIEIDFSKSKRGRKSYFTKSSLQEEWRRVEPKKLKWYADHKHQIIWNPENVRSVSVGSL